MVIKNGYKLVNFEILSEINLIKKYIDCRQMSGIITLNRFQIPDMFYYLIILFNGIKILFSICGQVGVKPAANWQTLALIGP